MSTLARLTTVTIKTLKSEIVVLADEELLDFLKSAKCSDTRILRSYFGIEIQEGDFYVGYEGVNKAPKKNW